MTSLVSQLKVSIIKVLTKSQHCVGWTSRVFSLSLQVLSPMAFSISGISVPFWIPQHLLSVNLKEVLISVHTLCSRCLQIQGALHMDFWEPFSALLCLLQFLYYRFQILPPSITLKLLLSSAGLPCSAPPLGLYIPVEKLSLGRAWGLWDSASWITLSQESKSYIPFFQFLKTVVSYVFSRFRVGYHWRSYSVSVTPSWMVIEILISVLTNESFIKLREQKPGYSIYPFFHLFNNFLRH